MLPPPDGNSSPSKSLWANLNEAQQKTALCFTARRNGSGRLIFLFPAAEEHACIVPDSAQGASSPFSTICFAYLSSSAWAFLNSGVLVRSKPEALPMNFGIGPWLRSF